MKVIIPLAGLGTRLRPHTYTKPKPLINVAGMPMLAHILDKFRGIEVEEYIFIVGYLGDQIEKYVSQQYGFKARYVTQYEMLGQAHALWLCRDYVNGPVFMVFGDTYFEADLDEIKTEPQDSIAYVQEVIDPRRFGVAVVGVPGGHRAHTGESRSMSGRLTPKERVKIPRQKMPEQEPASRRSNYSEVNLGLAASSPPTEASRCIACADPKCVKGCPVGVKVREFVEPVEQGDYKAAAAKMREDNVLPAVTGRVCPQEDQCEGACVMGKKFDPLAIGYLERFIADWEADSVELGLPSRAPLTGMKVACVGSGPAALTVAGDLVQKGHEVTVFEALHEVGGVLV